MRSFQHCTVKNNFFPGRPNFETYFGIAGNVNGKKKKVIGVSKPSLQSPIFMALCHENQNLRMA